MFSLARILLPVDFSERSHGAARYVESVAGHFGSELTLLHVLPPPHYEFSALEVGGTVLNELFANRAAQVRKELDEFLAEELKRLQVTRLLLEGDPAKKIVEHAHNWQAGLIVMPTHGYGPFRRFILGSVTAKVLHDADCPVWTGVHLEQAPPVRSIDLQNIVVAVDLGPQSGRALNWAAGLAAGFGSKLWLVHASACMQAAGEAPPPEWRDKFAVQAREALEKLRAGCGAPAEIIVETGDAPKTVCAIAARVKAGVLVIGRGSAAGMFGRLRTNAYAIIRESPCPVVSV